MVAQARYELDLVVSRMLCRIIFHEDITSRSPQWEVSFILGCCCESNLAESIRLSSDQLPMFKRRSIELFLDVGHT
jgi:hypothetical protein